jgi:hypothetical protein
MWTTRATGTSGPSRSPTHRSCSTVADMGADQRADGTGLPEDPDALEKIIEARRQHLAQTVDELAMRAQPKEIARRTANDAKQRAVGLVTDDSGDLRYERIAAAAAAVVLLVVLVVVRRRSGRA